MRRNFILILAAAALFATSSCGRNTLFKDGQTCYTIVIEPTAPSSELYAAQELQNWLHEVSGAEFPIAASGKRGKRLIVGYGPALQEILPGIEHPNDRDDSVNYVSKGGDILVWGGCKRGTLYSVYSFLEEELGARWYSARASVAPPLKQYRFGNLNHHETPGIRIRDNCFLEPRTNSTFSARMRNNFVRLPSKDGGTIPGTAEGYWGVHAMGHFLPASKYFKEHPEYFSYRDGKRLDGYSQPCLSNPDVLRICTEGVSEVMRNEPDFLIYSMEQCDNYLYCECNKCRALADQYGGQSGLMVWFVNQIADAVKDEFPDKFIGTFAYQYTRHAPKGIVPRENVVIRLCSIECCMIHGYGECEENLTFQKDMKDWAAIAPHLYIWDYVTDFAHYPLPQVNWRTLAPHIKDFRDNHAIGILEEGDYQTVSCEMREMRAWLLSKLMWNPDTDVDVLIKDFTDGYYGPAGSMVREYLALEERILGREGMHTNCYASTDHEMYTEEFVDEARKIFKAAKEAVANNPELLARVEAAEFPICYLEFELNPLKAMRSGADTLFRRVAQREGITMMNEPGSITAANYIAHMEDLRESLKAASRLDAVTASPKTNGVSFTKYEGLFLTTADMLQRGKVIATGIRTDIAIEEVPEEDHFGYVYKAYLQVDEDGLHLFQATCDDGLVLIVDGKEILNLDGSHSPLKGNAFVSLEKGFHSLEVRYFDDTEGQVLDLSLTPPSGKSASIPKEKLFLDE